MNLFNFESYINSIIVARGYDYYEFNNVISIEALGSIAGLLLFGYPTYY